MMQALSFDELKNMEKICKQCDECGESLVRIKMLDIEPFCQSCQKKKVEAQIMKRVKAAEGYEQRQKTYNWLRKRSIIMDKQLLDASFNTFHTETDKEALLKQQAQTFAQEYLEGRTYNTILTGTPGAGKSHLAMAMLKEVNESSQVGHRCLYIAVQEMMRRIYNSFNNPTEIFTEQYAVDMCREADVLVLDDLGAETGAITTRSQATDYTTKTLHGIMDGRQDKTTIITTNLNSDQLKKLYDDKLRSRFYKGMKARGSVLKFNDVKDKRVDLEF